jgi:hypothetical protein
MYLTHEGESDIPHLPAAACTVHIIPDLASHSLLSIGQLCDAGCKVEFTTTNVTVLHNDIQVLHGTHARHAAVAQHFAHQINRH